MLVGMTRSRGTVTWQMSTPCLESASIALFCRPLLLLLAAGDGAQEAADEPGLAGRLSGRIREGGVPGADDEHSESFAACLG